MPGVAHPQLPTHVPKGWKVYGVRVTLHNFKFQWIGARRNIGKQHEMTIAAPDRESARRTAQLRCFKTENMAELFIQDIEVWELDLPRGIGA